MENYCEICKIEIKTFSIKHIAGFPEREHNFCSEQCLTYFLRMEDDELDYGIIKGKVEK
ncbi:hypothetical protein [Bacillus sp. JJ1532]|uniref:hypothetical protein n=1 Tax=Bacillus sp. JJ1532 TaxID=3122958 RepID=UPI003F68AE8D